MHNKYAVIGKLENFELRAELVAKARTAGEWQSTIPTAKSRGYA